MKFIKIFILLLITHSIVNGQSVGISADNSSPDASAILDVKSSDKGMLVPRLTTIQRTTISSPATGLLVFDTNTTTFWFYNGSSWTNLISSGAGGSNISDADGDTKVEVESNPDDDEIRFTTNGVEMAKMDGTTFHIGTPDESIYIGNNAGENDSGVTSNVAIGINSLQQNITGERNVAIGNNTLNQNQIISGLIAIGDSALYQTGVGAFKVNHSINNIGIGDKTLKNNTLGANNIALGTNALSDNTTGQWNTAIGTETLKSNTNGDKNVAVGFLSQTNSNGDYNSSLGHETLKNNTTGDYNTAIGFESLKQNTQGNFNTGVGTRTLYYNSLGIRNTAIGYYSLFNNSTGNNNAAVGYLAQYKNTTGTNNVAIGTHALYENTVISNTVAIGDSALYNNGKTIGFGSSSQQNTAVGSKSLFSNDVGFYNTAMGFKSMMNNTSGSYNTGIGNNSMNTNTTGENNSAFGFESLRDNVDGDYNAAFGSKAIQKLAIGGENVAIGASSLSIKNSGEKNTAVGALSGQHNTTGDNNTLLGYQSGSRVTTGDNNTFLGKNAGSGSINHSKSGSVMIGHEAGYYENSSNKLYIDNSSTSNPLIYGDFNTNTLRVNGSFEIGNEYSLPLLDGGDGEILTTDGSGNLSWIGSAAGGLWTDAAGSNITYNAGNVGIGIVNPDSKLHIENSTQSDALEIKFSTTGPVPTNGISVYNSLNEGTGVKTGVSTIIIPGSSTSSNGIFSTLYALSGSPGDADDYTAVKAFANGEATALKAYTNNANGKAAVFEGDVEFKHFTGTSNQINIYPANMGGAVGRSTIYLASDAIGLVGHRIENDSSTFRIAYSSGGAIQDRFEIDYAGVVNIGNDAFILHPDVSGNSRFTTDEIEIRGGSDLAEYFDINNIEDQALEGSLVSIDPNDPGKLKITQDPFCPLIAGVISGAQGIKPGMMMGQEGTLAFGEYPVTLTGRVYVKANAEGGEINPGDILTSSSLKGQAMRVNSNQIQHGTTIGKALTKIDEDGYVLALISLN